jgi:dCMP deaminase
MSELIGTPFENYTPPTWSEWFIKQVYLVASKSKDPKTKIGAILVRDDRLISSGYNGICSGVFDSMKTRWERPEKYLWIEHAERNTIYSAAKHGVRTEGAILYTNAIPCADCARAVIQSGIIGIVVHKPYEDLWMSAQKEKGIDRVQWEGHDKISMTMFKEAEIKIKRYKEPVGAFAYLDGKEYIV